MYREMGMTYWLEQAELEMKGLAWPVFRVGFVLIVWAECSELSVALARNGCLLTVACACGVPFERWVTSLDANV
jgi:hypothetical protein